MSRVILLLALFYATLAHAHKPSDSYITLTVEGEHIAGQWDIALRDLDYAIGLDANDDGSITWGELRAKQPEIAAYALPHLKISSAGIPCASQVQAHLVDQHSDGVYAVMRFSVECSTPPQTLELSYSLFAELDPQHKGLLSLQYQGNTRTAIFGVEQPTQRFELTQPDPWRQFMDFITEGVWHIWIGFDHILFLLALLLPAVLIRNAGRWSAVTDFRGAFWNVVKIVTAFTVAHSITLSLAALSIIELPSRLVETTIAASIIVGAANNIYPVIYNRLWMVAFAFGLIHGFGFASVLADLHLPQNTLLRSLVGFNVGVELGQLAIVALFLPLAFWLRGTQFYQRYILVAGSLAIAILAAIWMAERFFEFKLLPV